MERETLCWSCDNRKCSWRQSFEPVKGWDAQKNIIKPDDTESYRVWACPEYHLWDRYLRWIIAANADEVHRGKPVLDDMVLGAMPTADAVMIKTRLTGAPISSMARCYNKPWWQIVKTLKKSVNQYLEIREAMETAEPDDDMKIYDPATMHINADRADRCNHGTRW